MVCSVNSLCSYSLCIIVLVFFFLIIPYQCKSVSKNSAPTDKSAGT
jgi:hypothetical protein